MHAVILAGGYGTRLRDIWDAPKCLVPVAGTPVIAHLLEKLILLPNPPDKVVLVLGHKSSQILEWLWSYSKFRTYTMFDHVYVVVEEEPGGTAAALRRVLPTTIAPIMVMNGDTVPRYNLEPLLDAYARLEPHPKMLHGVAAWHKGRYAGISILAQSAIDTIVAGKTTDLDFYLAGMYHHEVSEGYLDIGTPEDFYRAQGLNVLSIEEQA